MLKGLLEICIEKGEKSPQKHEKRLSFLYAPIE